MMDGVDLDVAQARADLLPDKYDRRRISQALAIRRLSSRHYKRPMSEGNVRSGWMLLLLLVCSLHHIHSRYWQSFKRRHALLICFVSLPLALCWKVGKKLWKEFGLSDVLYACFVSLPVALRWKANWICQKLWNGFMELDAVCDGVMMLGLYWEVIFELWLFLKRHWLTTEVHIMYIELDEGRPRRAVGLKVNKDPVIRVVYEMVLCHGTGWVWFRSLLIGPSHLVIRQLLIISGDVEVNPGPLDHESERILSKVDDTYFEEDDWNILIDECSSLCAQWDKITGSLGLRPSLIASIRRNNPNDNTGCWNDALLEWISQNYNTEKFGLPSWRTFLTAVAKVDKLQFKKLAAEHQAKTKSIASVPSATESSLNESKGAEGGTSGTTELNKAPSSPISASVNLGPEQKQQRYERVSSKSQEMGIKFQKLFTATKKSLRDKKVPISELVGHLECLGFIKPTFKDAGLSPLRHQLPKLAKSETVDDVMSIVKDYCSFFNYHILAHIIDEFGNLKDKENLGAYKKDFEEYAQCCVIEGPLEVGKMNEEGFSNMFVTLDDSFDNCTLSHLNVFIADLRKVLKISSDVDLRLCRINCGSIKLIFQLPHSDQEDIFPLCPKQEASLADLGVVELSCGDYQFTRRQNKEVEDPCVSDGGDSDYADSDAELASMTAGLTLRNTPSISADSALTVERSSYTGTSAAVTVATEDIGHRPDLDDPDMGMGHDSSGCELRQASHRGDLEAVKYLTEEKLLSPLQEDKDGRNAIYYAAKGGQLGVLKYFTEEQGHNPASQSSTGRLAGRTPLHIAAEFNRFELVQYLVAEQQMDPMCQNINGSTPLHVACQGDNIDVVIYLVNAMSKYLPLKDVVSCRGKYGQTPLHHAALKGELKIVKYFITELNCDPNIEMTGEHHGRPTVGGGRIALHNAAQMGHLHVVKFLIEDQHCDPSHCDNKKVTPLHMAAQNGHLAVVQYLTLEQHCDPLCIDKKNNTPLHDAARHGHLQVVKFMIETLCCSPDVRGLNNETPQDKACRQGHHHVVKYLESISPILK